MSEPQNPLFDEEKEFLERKKLEYERALRGDVDHIKDQSVKAGKVAAIGAGLAGSIWLITKIFGGKKRKKRRSEASHEPDYQADYYYRMDDFDGEEFDADANTGADDGLDSESGPGYYTAGNGKRYKSTVARKSAAASASAFVAHHEQTHEADDLGFGSKAAAQSGPVAAKANSFEEDPFQDLPYDDSRRLPVSHAFDGEHRDSTASPSHPRSRILGSMLQSFLQSETGKVLAGQVAAVALAAVTKKASQFFPTAKNSDLAAPPGPADTKTGASPAASSAPSVSSDAFNPPQSL